MDSLSERKRVHWLRDGLIAIKHAYFFDETRDDYQQIAGNYIVMKYAPGIYLVFAHLQTHSIQVKENQQVKKGDLLGHVGHSGNSMAPHLHFQVMDSRHIQHAQGIPCLFETYQSFQDDA